MPLFTTHRDAKTGECWLETSLTGKNLLDSSPLNKSTAFNEQERREFRLTGKLPARIETLDEQVERAYLQYKKQRTGLQANIFLHSLLNKNQILFYKLVTNHLAEMLPIIYTPIVGKAVKNYSQAFRQPRGLYISYEDRDHIEEILDNRTNDDISLVVVSDGEGVLGLGDQGIGAMDIPIAKLMVYTLCGGINPNVTLPIMLDVGTNNQQLLNDRYYLGWRHERIRGKEYDDFIETFVNAIKKKFPHAFLHWEDFSRENSRRNLDRFRSEICTFNDDMQGTGAVTLSALLSAVKAQDSKLTEQRFLVFGGGTAGTGISDQIHATLTHLGLSVTEAYQRFWIIDRDGLIVDGDRLTPGQQPYARSRDEVASWTKTEENHISIEETIEQVKPTVLIGCSGVGGAFTETIIRTMAKHVQRPIILPLSNPPECCEATPNHLIEWTDGKALIATGSPFDHVRYEEREVPIAQCNNALIFPGIGLGVLAVQASQLTDHMIWSACQALAKVSPILSDPQAPLLPSLNDARQVARDVAIAVAERARKEGLAQKGDNRPIEELVDEMIWEPHYLPYKRKTD